jgi:hypothetical protein
MANTSRSVGMGAAQVESLAQSSQMKQDTASPINGASVSFTSDGADRILTLTPAGALATLTVVFPAAASARIGQLCCITTSQTIGLLSVAGTTVTGLVASVSGGDLYSYRYVGGNTWRRCI